MRAIKFTIPFLLIALSVQAAGQQRVFNGSADGSMANAANWDTGLPNDNDSILFSSSTTRPTIINDLPTGRMFTSLTFSGSANWTLQGTSSITTPRVIFQSSGTLRIECPINIATVDTTGAPYGFTGAGGTTFEFVGALTGSPATDVGFDAGTLKFLGVNTMTPTGSYFLNGSIQIGHAGCFATNQKVTVGNTYNMSLTTDMNCGYFNHQGGGGIISLSGHVMNIGAGSATASFIGANVDAGTNGKIVKTGTGGLQVEKYTTVGTLEIAGGTTTVKPNNANVNIVVKSGGTLDLSAANIGPYKSISGQGGIISLSASNPVAVETFSLDAASTLKIFGGQPIAASSTATLGSATLDTSGIVTPLGNGTRLDIATFASGTPGTFFNLSEQASLTVGGGPAYVTYLSNKATLVGGNSSGKQTPTITIAVPPPNPSYFTDKPITFTVTVSGNIGVPTGTVTLQAGSSLQTLTLNGSGVASAVLPPFIPAGPLPVTATYSGNANYFSANASNSLQIEKVPTQIGFVDLASGGTLFDGFITAQSSKVVFGGLGVAGSSVISPSGTVTLTYIGQNFPELLSSTGTTEFTLDNTPPFQSTALPLIAAYPGDDVHAPSTTTVMVRFPSLANTDGDGFTDAAETAVGTNPNDPTSYPGQDSGSIVMEPVSFSQCQVDLDFKNNLKNGVKFNFIVSANGNTDPVTGLIVIGAGPIEQTFNIGDDGKLVAPEKGDKLKITVDKKKDQLKVAGALYGLKKATPAEMKAAGFNDENIKLSKATLKLYAVIRNVFFGFDVDLLYSAQKGKRGRATLDKSKR